MPSNAPVQFRTISPDQQAVDLHTSSGRKLTLTTATGGRGMFELVATRSTHTAAPFQTPFIFSSTAGQLAMNEPIQFFSLLSGVPPSTEGASEAEKRQRLSHCLARLPRSFTTVFGHCHVKDLTEFNPCAVELAFTIHRDDIKVSVRARASRYFWLEMLNAMESSPAHPTEMKDATELNQFIEFGRGTYPFKSIGSLRKGAVLIMEDTYFARDGSGLIPYGKTLARVQWQYLSGRQTLSILSIGHPIGDIPTSAANTMAHDSDFNDPEMYDDQDDEDEPLEDPVPGDEPSDSSVDIDGVHLRLVAELGHVNTTIGNLKSFAPGSYAIVEGRGHREVVLRIDGGPIFAYAEIVEIEGRLGLQIKQVVA